MHWFCASWLLLERAAKPDLFNVLHSSHLNTAVAVGHSQHSSQQIHQSLLYVSFHQLLQGF